MSRHETDGARPAGTGLSVPHGEVPDGGGTGESMPSGPSGGSVASFPYDRMTVERFRQAFPRARWRDDLQAWFVPGNTARKRVDQWFERERGAADVFADAKGRDDYAFDPLVSRYLAASGEGLEIRTPFSRTVVSELREVPFARFDSEAKCWLVPYRSLASLRERWPLIEEAARRNEPEERRRRQEEARGSDEERQARARAAERRRRRYPVLPDHCPPLLQPVMTRGYGILIFTAIDGEIADEETLRHLYPELSGGKERIWATWRPASLAELVETWPARREPDEQEWEAGWWQPTKPELREARKRARAQEKRLEGRPLRQAQPEGNPPTGL